MRPIEHVREFFSECLVVPRKVKIKNWRIGLLLCILRVFVLTYVVVVAWRFRIWYEVMTPNGSTGFWLSKSVDIASSIATERLQAPHCDKSLASRYDYVYAKGWTYTNSSCLQLPDHLTMIKRTDGMFIPTYVEEKLATRRHIEDVDSDTICDTECFEFGKNGAKPNEHSSYVASGRLNRYGHCICESAVVQNSFVLGVEKRKIGLELAALLEHPDGRVEVISHNDVNNNLLVILRSTDTHEETRRVLPGETLELEIGELLTLAGKTLEDRYETNANLLGEGFNKYPVLRITGFDMTLAFRYYNYDDRNHREGHYHEGPVCYVEVMINPKWASMVQAVEDPGDLFDTPGLRSRYMYGINIHIQMAGGFSKFNIQGIFQSIATTIVYMQIPLLFVVFLTEYLLGPLSVVYRKAQIHHFTLRSALNGYCARILVAKETYMSMLKKQIKAHSTQLEHLTAITFRHQMFSVIEEDQRGDRSLSESEISTLIEVVMPLIDSDNSATVRLPEYLKSHSNDEPCELHDLACLFDFDRRRGILETLFEPAFLKKAKKSLAEQEAQESPDIRMSVLQSSGSRTAFGPYDSRKLTAVQELRNEVSRLTCAQDEAIEKANATFDRMKEEVSRLKCTQEEAVEKANVTFDRMVAQIDQLVASRLEHLGDRLGEAVAEFQGWAPRAVDAKPHPVDGHEDQMSQVVSRLEQLRSRMGSVVTEFQGQNLSDLRSKGLGVNGIATSSEQATPLGEPHLVHGDTSGGFPDSTSAFLREAWLVQKGQNYAIEMLKAQCADLEQRVASRFASVEHEHGRLADEFYSRRVPLEGAGAVQHPQQTPNVDIDRRSTSRDVLNARIEGLRSEVNAMQDSEEQRIRILAGKNNLPERVQGAGANESVAHPASQASELSARLTKLEHELRNLEDVVWQVRDDMGTLDWSWKQMQAIAEESPTPSEVPAPQQKPLEDRV